MEYSTLNGMSETHTKLPKHRWYCRRGSRKIVKAKSQGNSVSSTRQDCCPHGLTKLCLSNKTHTISSSSTYKPGGEPTPQQLRAIGEGESVFYGRIAPGRLTTVRQMLPYLHTCKSHSVNSVGYEIFKNRTWSWHGNVGKTWRFGERSGQNPFIHVWNSQIINLEYYAYYKRLPCAFLWSEKELSLA